MTTLRPELLDELLTGYEKPEDLLGEDGLFKELKKALLERALGAELSDHLGYPAGRGTGNSRNGHSDKRVLTEDGEVDLAVPRDRNGTFEPAIVPKGERRLDGFDDRIVSLYARGMTVREIRGHLEELYGVAVSPDLISRVTDAVLEEVREWQNRPLDPVYPVVFFDALRVKIRDEGLVRNKGGLPRPGDHLRRRQGGAGAVDRADRGGQVLAQGDERAPDPRPAGYPDRGGGRADGLSQRYRHGVPAHRGADLHRASDPQLLGFRLLEGSQEGHADLKAVYRAETAEAAAARLDEFEARWGQRYPAVVPAWRRAWEHVVPMFAFPPAIRKMIYTTNALESLHRSLRKIIKTRGSFPSDEAAAKLLFLAIRNAGVRLRRPVDWIAAMGQYAILFEDRFPATAR